MTLLARSLGPFSIVDVNNGVVPPSLPAEGEVYWFADFEEGYDSSDWNRDGGGQTHTQGGGTLSYVSENPTPFSGTYCQKALTPSGTGLVRRAEGGRWRESTYYDNRYYGGAVYFPSSFSTSVSNDWVTFFQLHAPSSPSGPYDHFAILEVLPGIEVIIRRNWPSRQILYHMPGSIGTDVWHTFVLHLVTGDLGLLEF